MSDSDSHSEAGSERVERRRMGQLGFDREPRFSAEELAARAENEPAASALSADDEEEDATVWPPESRLGNTSWCECGKCVAMPDRMDCLCCHDAAVTLERSRESGAPCVTAIADFDTVVLHRAVLATALRGYFERRKQPMPVSEQPDNRSLRYAAYRQYTLFIHGRLGRQVRFRIPSCVVASIRRTYPNPAGVPYRGFSDTGDEPTQWPEH